MTLDEMREIKEKRGYSLTQLSTYTGVPVVTLQKVFSGKSRSPRKATLDAIERVLTADEEYYQGRSYSYKNTVKENMNFSKLADPSAYSSRGSSLSSELVQEESSKHEKKQGEYTIDDYRSLPEERRVELIDGVFYDMSSPRLVHQDIASIVHIAIYNYIRKNKGNCKVFEASVDVQLDMDDKTMVQPDVLVICDRDKMKDFGIYGAPDFVLEILSASTRKKDLTIKLWKYQNAGVREYWIIDPKKKVLITYNFMEEEWLPNIIPLQGIATMAIFNNKLEISLDEIRESIEEFG